MMHTRMDDFSGLRGAIARAGLAVVAFGVLTALPLLGSRGSLGADSTPVAQAVSADTRVQGDTSCRI